VRFFLAASISCICGKTLEEDNYGYGQNMIRENHNLIEVNILLYNLISYLREGFLSEFQEHKRGVSLDHAVL